VIINIFEAIEASFIYL